MIEEALPEFMAAVQEGGEGEEDQVLASVRRQKETGETSRRRMADPRGHEKS